MTEEEYFRKNYPDSCYGDKPLSPHWDFFQDGVEFGERQSEKKIAELEKENTELQHKVDTLQGFLDRDVEFDNLQKENAELKKKNLDTQDAVTMQMYTNKANKEIADRQLTKAKELLKEFCTYYMYDCDETRKDYETFEELKEQAEQFLSEVSK